MSEHSTSLQKAKKLIQDCPPADTRVQRTELRKSQLAKEKLELASTLPVEEKAKQVIEQRIELLDRTVEDPLFEERYPYLSMEVLRWRNEGGLPKFAVFPLNNSLFSIQADYHPNMLLGNEWEVKGTFLQLPKAVAEMYNDIVEQFHDELLKEQDKNQNRQFVWKKRIAARFSGIIPQWVRKKIQEATPDFSVSFQRTVEQEGWFRQREVVKTYTAAHIYILAEVDKWEVNKEVIPHPDPLVVGYKAGCLWLICSFDETPLEEYVRREFSA